jgi:hypothetical protein
VSAAEEALLRRYFELKIRQVCEAIPLAPKVQVRAAGGQVVAPWAEHAGYEHDKACSCGNPAAGDIFGSKGFGSSPWILCQMPGHCLRVDEVEARI